MSQKKSLSEMADSERALPMRLWLAAPDWLFRLVGAAGFLLYLLFLSQKYWGGNFWEQVDHYKFDDNTTLYMPWIPVLVDLTFVLIALGFCLRLPPRNRATNGWIIVFTLFTGFYPLIAFYLPAVLASFIPSWQPAIESLLRHDDLSLTRGMTGSMLLTVGNLLDVWGYAVLTRSFGIVPEARELKTSGPYHFVRHPVYLGQFLSQAGVWLCIRPTHVLWISVYVVFVAMQLYRSKLEDRVLADAFGDEYREWQRRTFWFV